MPLALRLALREMRSDLRSGFSGFRIFLACLAIGVAGIAGVGSVSAALKAGLEANAATALGGDLEFTLQQRDLPATAIDWLAHRGRLSQILDMRGMARRLDNTRPVLVAVKAVDSDYPLYGRVALQPAIPLEEALSVQNKVPGIAVAPQALDALGLHLGDRLRLGNGIFDIRAVLTAEPDAGGFFEMGQPVLISRAGLGLSGLDLPGALATHAVRVRLDRPARAKAVLAEAQAAFPDEDWQAREATTASPMLSGFINQADTMLVLVGLAALLLGGIGVAQAIGAHLDKRRATIAILKCVGASSGLIMAIYLIEIMAIALIGIGIGLVIGGALPWIVNIILADRLPIALEARLYPHPLGFAAACGALVALACLIGSLAGIRGIAAAAQLRGPLAPASRWRDRVWVAVPLGILADLVVMGTGAPLLTIEAGGGVAAAMILFLSLGYGITALARMMSRLVARQWALSVRLGLANLHRPGAATPTAVLALGLGLSVLIAVSQIDGNLERLMGQALPKRAPSLFFIDIQPDQVDPFAALARTTPGVSDITIVPSLRTRVVAIKGARLDTLKLSADTRQIIDGDRGLTYAASLSPGSRVVSGVWWPADYHGPPILSLDDDLARKLHLTIGDSMTLNVAGREITAKVANTRHIDWGSLGINFFIVMAPGTLEPAPQTHIATVRAADLNAEEALEQRVIEQFPNVSSFSIAAALAKVATILQGLGAGIRAMAALLLAAGLLVLAAIEAAARERRIADATLLQTLGASRFLLARSYVVEFGLLGVMVGVIATATGTLGAWVMVTRVMQIPWTALIVPIVAIPACAVPLTMIIGFAGTWRALGGTGRRRA